MFQSVKNYFEKTEGKHAEIKKLEGEADQFKLPSEGFPQVLKVIFFIGLACLNYRLFAHSIPGLWGQATGVVACMCEGLALYCLYYFSRSAGAFRLALGACGGVLMLFSLIHGTFSILDLMHISTLGATIKSYSHVAFPVLAGLLGLSLIAITMSHPNSLVRLREALAHTKIVQSRAEAASDLKLMRTSGVIEDARLEHRQEQVKRQSAYLNTLKQYIGIEQEKRNLIASIPDPRLRQELAQEIGMDLSEHDSAPTKAKPGFLSQNSAPGNVSD